MDKQWSSDDITFCTNYKCPITKCKRNHKNIQHNDIPHCFADLDGHENYCFKVSGKEDTYANLSKKLG